MPHLSASFVDESAQLVVSLSHYRAGAINDCKTTADDRPNHRPKDRSQDGYDGREHENGTEADEDTAAPSSERVFE
jgi:hypothetical protein